MKTPKVQEVKLPYASTVASFFSDQGNGPGGSFLGKFFKGGARTSITQTQPNTATTVSPPGLGLKSSRAK